MSEHLAQAEHHRRGITDICTTAAIQRLLYWAETVESRLAAPESTPPAPTGQDEENYCVRHRQSRRACRILEPAGACFIGERPTPAPPEPDSIAPRTRARVFGHCNGEPDLDGKTAIYSSGEGLSDYPHFVRLDEDGTYAYVARVEPVTPALDATGEPEVGAVVRDKHDTEWERDEHDRYPWRTTDRDVDSSRVTWADLVRYYGPLTVVSRPSPTPSTVPACTAADDCRVPHHAHSTPAPPAVPDEETVESLASVLDEFMDLDVCDPRDAARAVLAAGYRKADS